MFLHNLFGIIWLTVSKVASRAIIHSPEDERHHNVLPFCLVLSARRYCWSITVVGALKGEGLRLCLVSRAPPLVETIFGYLISVSPQLV